MSKNSLASQPFIEETPELELKEFLTHLSMYFFKKLHFIGDHMFHSFNCSRKEGVLSPKGILKRFLIVQEEKVF